MQFRTVLFLSLLIFFASCEKDVFENEDFDGTWTVDWIRCDNFHNKVFGEITFVVNDSDATTGVIKEILADTINEMTFHFQFLSDEELLIDTLYDDVDSASLWLGTHTISELQENSFLLERETETCERELYKFVK